MGNIYFASDLHLGFPDPKASRDREKLFVRWLDEIKTDAREIFLVGDVFDFWFDYKRSVPKGYTRLLGKVAELTDAGIPVHFFTGNHDIWLFGYFEEELNARVHRHAYEAEFNGKKFYIAHGDGLGPGDHGYKFLKRIFTNSLCQWLFRWLHPDIGISVAQFWSRQSRENGRIKPYLGEEKEWLIIHSKDVLKQKPIDFFVYGHRHLPLEVDLNGFDARYVNLGDWVEHMTYAVFNGEKLELKKYVSH